MTTIDFYADGIIARDAVLELLARGVWFSVDPYPDDFVRIDVKPEAARWLQALGLSEVAP